MDKSKAIKLIAVHHPVDNARREIHRIPYHRQRLKTLAKKYMPNNDDLLIRVNQNSLSEIEQKDYRCRPGDEIIMVPALRFGLVEGIGALVMAMTATETIGAALWTIGLNLAVAIGGGYLLSMLGPKPKTPKLDGLNQSQSFSFNPHTVQKQGTVRPRGYGQVKHTGNLVSPYTTASGESETLNMVLA